MSEIDVLSLARKHGLIPEGELPKFPVERFIDYPGRLEELQAFADEVAKRATAVAQKELRGIVAESQGMNVLHDIAIAQRDSLRRELAEAQALLKAKDEALRLMHDHLRLYKDGYDKGFNVFDVAEQALAQTSGTDALDKMLEEAEQRGYGRWLRNSGKPIECNRVAGVGGVVSTHCAKECLTKGE